MAFVELSEIMRVFTDEHKTVAKGENALNSNHVLNVTQDHENGMLLGEVQASQKQKAYKVRVSNFLKEINFELQL